MNSKLSSTEMIKLNVYQFVLESNKAKKFPTVAEIRENMNRLIEQAPYLFGDSTVTSSKGTMRSMLSELLKMKENRRINNVMFHEINGIPKFFVDPLLVVQNQIENNSKELFETENNTIHTDSQYMLCDIFTNLGYGVFVPKGDRSQKNSFGQTIQEAFSNNIVEITDSVGKFIDVVITKNGKPFKIFEVEESTNIRNGLTRMTRYKSVENDVESFVVSSKESYQKKFDKESKWEIFSDLNSIFIPYSDLKQIFDNQKDIKLVKKFLGENI